MINFFNIPIVNLALSLMICWGLFAIFCSIIFEWFAQIKAERGRFMKYHLQRQLNDRPNGVNWASLIYLHGTIDLLTRDSHRPTNEISSTLFANTIFEVVGKSHIVQTKIDNVLKARLTYQNISLANFEAATLVLNPSDVITMLTHALSDAESKGTTNGIKNEAIIYECLIHNIKNWYNEFSQRLSWWYKKESRNKLFWIGMVLGILVNVDSLQLFAFLNDNSSSQSEIDTHYNRHQISLENFNSGLSRGNQIDTLSTHENTLHNTRDFLKEVDQLRLKASLPIGFKYSILNDIFGDSCLCKRKKQPQSVNSNVSPKENVVNQSKTMENSPVKCPKLEISTILSIIIYKFFGVIITGFAVSFGAPFWFDILRRVSKKY